METLFMVAICVVGFSWLLMFGGVRQKGWDNMDDESKRYFIIHTLVYFGGTFLFCFIYTR